MAAERLRLYPASGVDTPSLNPSGSLNWNIRTPHGRSAGSLSNAPPLP